MPKGIYQHKKNQGFQRGHIYFKGREKPKITIFCKYCNEEIKVNPCYRNKQFCSMKCKALWQSDNLQKENNPNWQNNKWQFSKRIKQTIKWKGWRKTIFKRDDYVCQYCRQKGYELVPHHLKSKQVYPELVFQIDNGITLCKKCHKLIHKIKPANQTIKVNEYPLSLLKNYALSY